MNPALDKALTMMGVALPTMIVVIGLIMAAAKLLSRAFPAAAEIDDEAKKPGGDW